jgi:hypothetical protein
LLGLTEVFKTEPLHFMSFMDAMVPRVKEILENRNALSGNSYLEDYEWHGEGKYTGETGTIRGLKLRHGYGRMDFTNGDWYQGDWYGDAMHGTGCFYHKHEGQDFGYDGVFDTNSSVDGVYYFGNRISSGQWKFQRLKLNVLYDDFWKLVYQRFTNEQNTTTSVGKRGVTALLAQLQLHWDNKK